MSILPIEIKDEEILKTVTEYLIKDFEIPEEKIHPEANLFTDLELDSVDALDWFATMESEIKLSIVEEELKKIRTVRDVVAYVKRNRPAGA
jgi:acyl carrier protein